MNICYAATRNYYQYMPTVINSVLSNNSKVERVYVFAEDDEIPCINHSKVTIINVDNYPQFLYVQNKSFDIYTRMIAYKLAVTKILPELDRCLFLDVDTMVDGDLEEMYNSNMDAKFYGMAQEWSTAWKFGYSYYNAGVILMNLETIRRQHLEDLLLNRLNMVNFGYPEQEVLNQYVNKKSILELDPIYNFCITSKFPDTKPIIWHFQCTPKQWEPLANPTLWNKYHIDILTDKEVINNET